jgi:quercetin dioxygenase-like cupin family protein
MSGPRAEVVDVAGLLASRPAGERAVLWSAGNQLQTNVVSLAPGARIDAHAEPALDVTVAVLVGSVQLLQGAEASDVRAPAVVVLPAGAERALTAGPDGVTYLTAHRARPGMLPALR